MRNLLLLIFFSSISLISLAQCAHNDHNEIRYYNETEILDINKQNILRNQSIWKEFLSNNGNWYVIFNERTGLPHRAFGQPIGLNNGIDDNASVLNFLNNSFDLPSDLRFSNKTINPNLKPNSIKKAKVLTRVSCTIFFRASSNFLPNNIYNSFISTQKVNLGRWEHRENDKQREIKSIWANSDNCGDRICGQPEVIREITNIRKH